MFIAWPWRLGERGVSRISENNNKNPTPSLEDPKYKIPYLLGVLGILAVTPSSKLTPNSQNQSKIVGEAHQKTSTSQALGCPCV